MKNWRGRETQIPMCAIFFCYLSYVHKNSGWLHLGRFPGSFKTEMWDLKCDEISISWLPYLSFIFGWLVRSREYEVVINHFRLPAIPLLHFSYTKMRHGYVGLNWNWRVCTGRTHRHQEFRGYCEKGPRRLDGAHERPFYPYPLVRFDLNGDFYLTTGPHHSSDPDQDVIIHVYSYHSLWIILKHISIPYFEDDVMPSTFPTQSSNQSKY